MFTEQLRLGIIPLTESNPKDSNLKSSNMIFSQSDLQYEICSTFMKFTCQKLSIKETEIMQGSRKFIDTYSNFKKKQIDSSRTLDTLIQQGYDKSQSLDCEYRQAIPLSKSPSYSSKKKGMSIGNQLIEIRERCSYSCFVFISSLVAEYKKLEGKIRNYQNRETSLGKREESGQRFHEQNLIKRLQYQNQRIQQLQKEIQILREKNRSINSCINEKISSMSHSTKYFQINNKIYRDIKNYLNEKENMLKKQSERIAGSQLQIVKTLENAFKQEFSCNKCCQIIRKLKDSILKFRKCLQGQSLQFERLYDKYKKTMYTSKSRTSL